MALYLITKNSLHLGMICAKFGWILWSGYREVEKMKGQTYGCQKSMIIKAHLSKANKLDYTLNLND